MEEKLTLNKACAIVIYKGGKFRKFDSDDYFKNENGQFNKYNKDGELIFRNWLFGTEAFQSQEKLWVVF